MPERTAHNKMLHKEMFAKHPGSTIGPARKTARKIVRILALTSLVLMLIATATIIAYRFIPPPGSTLMLGRAVTGKPIRHTWVPISKISPNIIRAVITSEDSRFCSHYGIDWVEIRQAIKRAKNGQVRGASTISMQTSKNLFLWPQRSYIRKAIEIPLTLMMELIWPKRRMLEIYLNIAEWGPGVFGVEAASRHHFKKSARHITRTEASRLAASLPNPIVRRAGRPGPKTKNHSNKILKRMTASPPDTSCIFAK